MESPLEITKEKVMKHDASTRLQTSESTYMTEGLPSVERRNRRFITEDSPLITEQSYLRPQFTKQRNHTWNDEFLGLDEKVKEYIKKLEYKKELEAQILENSLRKKHTEEIQNFEEKMQDMRSAYKRLLDVFIKGVTQKYSRPRIKMSNNSVTKENPEFGSFAHNSSKPKIPPDIFSPLRKEKGEEDSQNNTLNNSNSRYYERKIRVLPGKLILDITH